MGPILKSALLFTLMGAVFILSACGPAVKEQPAATGTPKTLAAESARVPTSPSSPATMPQGLTTGLPPSMVFDKLLNGSGNVSRRLLTYNDMLGGASAAPVDDSAFALPAEAALPAHVFEGRLEIFAEAGNDGFQKIRDDYNYSAEDGRLHIPKFNYEFVQDGSYLIPCNRLKFVIQIIAALRPIP